MPSALWPMNEAFPLAGHTSRGCGWHTMCWQKPSRVECPGLPELLPAQVRNVDGCKASHGLGPQASPCLIPRSEDILRGSLVTIMIVPHYEAFKFCLCFHGLNFYLPRQLLSPVMLPSGVGSYYQDRSYFIYINNKLLQPAINFYIYYSRNYTTIAKGK